MVKKDEVGAELARIDQRLPKLASSCLGFSASIVSGVGTCGLGKYADGMKKIVREQHLTQFFAKNSTLLGTGNHASRLAAIAEAQAAALQRMKDEREELLIGIAQRTKVERQQEALQRQEREAEAEAQRRDLALRLQAERDESARIAELRQRRIEREREEQRAVQAIDEENHRAMLAEEAEAEAARKQALKAWVRKSKEHARTEREELRRARAANKAAVEARSQSALDFRLKIEAIDSKKRKEMVEERHAEHELSVMEIEERRAEEREAARKLTKTIPNADAITRRRAQEVSKVLKTGRKKRDELQAVRSVSSLR
jgi:hypothetical protein